MSFIRPTTPKNLPANIPTATARKTTRNVNLQARDIHPVKMNDMANIARDLGLSSVAATLRSQANYNARFDFYRDDEM